RPNHPLRPIAKDARGRRQEDSDWKQRQGTALRKNPGAACIYLLFIPLGQDLAALCLDDVVRPATVAHGIQEFIVEVPAFALPSDADAKIVEIALAGFGVQPGDVRCLLR